MAEKISRTLQDLTKGETVTVTIATAVANSTEIQFGGHAGGLVYVPTGTSMTTLTWYASPKSGGTFYAVEDGAAGAIQSTVSGGDAVPIPPECYGAAVLKIEADAAGTAGVTLKG